jgi:hypothetical protein
MTKETKDSVGQHYVGQEYEQDESLLALAQKIQEAEKPACGIIFFISDEKRLSARNDPNIIPGWDHDKKLEYAEMTLACLQEIRYRLGQYFDLDSEKWKEQPIAELMNFCENRLRCTVYHMRDGSVYNMRHVLSFGRSLFDIAKFLSSKGFNKKWFKLTKLHSLNREAARVQNELRGRNLEIMNAMLIQALSTLGDMYDLYPETHVALEQVMGSEVAAEIRARFVKRLAYLTQK